MTSNFLEIVSIEIYIVNLRTQLYGIFIDIANWQANPERGPLAYPADDLDIATEFVDVIAGLVYADPHAGLALGTVKRAEQAIPDELLVHARPRVLDLDDRGIGTAEQADDDPAIIRGGILGVADQMPDDGCKPVAVGLQPDA